MASAQDSIDAYQNILGRRTEIEQGQDRLEQARAAIKDWDLRLQESAKLSSRKYELDAALNAAQAKIEADLREITATVNLLSPKAAAVDRLRTQLTEGQAELGVLQSLESEQKTQRDSLAGLGSEAARLEEQNRQLKLEMDDIKANLTQLEAAGSTCPVCKRPLEEEHRSEVEIQFQQEGKAKGDLFRANRSRLEEVVAEQNSMKQQIAKNDKQLRGLAKAQRSVAQLEQSLEEASAAAVELQSAQTEQDRLQKRLDSRDFAPQVLVDLTEVEAELAALGYDKNAHDQARSDVEQLLHFEEESRALSESKKRIKEEEKRLEREQSRHSRLMAQTAADRETVTELEQATAGLADLINQLDQASAEVNNLQRDERFARDKVAAANQKLSHIVYVAKERGKQEDKLQQIREALGIYRELQVAFGKKGIQALLIENAIPEIEDEANTILGRMTDGRMNIRFETQREAKSSDNTIETLDIRISDEMGTRDYELYSGGETFRINFAIRIAISKVLARRSGAALQTLVIDEGFGTQDVQGRERLVEAINAIQDDFEKIIVITHIDELKDAFPVQVEIRKTIEGSQVEIRY